MQPRSHARGAGWWWLIAGFVSLSAPGSAVACGFALLASRACDTSCTASDRWTVLLVLAVLAFVLSMGSAVTLATRRGSLAHASATASVVVWVLIALFV